MVDNDDPIMVRQIINAAGYDTETGIYGVGYSPDNGKTFYVQNTSAGRKFRQQDADGLWPFLKNKIGEIKGGSLSVSWSQITGKPNVATKDDVNYLKTLIGSSSGSGDAGLTIEAIVELIKHHLKAKVDVNSGNLLIDVDGVSNGSIADAVATKVAQSLQLKLQGSDLVAEIGGTE